MINIIRERRGIAPRVKQAYSWAKQPCWRIFSLILFAHSYSSKKRRDIAYRSLASNFSWSIVQFLSLLSSSFRSPPTRNSSLPSSSSLFPLSPFPPPSDHDASPCGWVWGSAVNYPASSGAKLRPPTHFYGIKRYQKTNLVR